jgi:hypothetical protein
MDPTKGRRYDLQQDDHAGRGAIGGGTLVTCRQGGHGYGTLVPRRLDRDVYVGVFLLDEIHFVGPLLQVSTPGQPACPGIQKGEDVLGVGTVLEVLAELGLPGILRCDLRESFDLGIEKIESFVGLRMCLNVVEKLGRAHGCKQLPAVPGARMLRLGLFVAPVPLPGAGIVAIPGRVFLPPSKVGVPVPPALDHPVTLSRGRGAVEPPPKPFGLPHPRLPVGE